MEVHQHSNTAHYSGKKKWSHYFWEFLMLFLAVFCGFLAENKREHVVERHRARDYAKSLLVDMNADTTELALSIRYTGLYLRYMDSLIVMNFPDNKTVPGKFYYYSRFASNTFIVDWNESTLNQLILSGNLRYFANKEFVNLINKYYAQQQTIRSFNQTDHEHRNLLTDLRNRIVLVKYLSVFSNIAPIDVINGQPLPPILDSLTLRSLEIQPNSFSLIETFRNHLTDRRWRQRQVANKYYPEALKTATEIINMIKEEYHFD